MIAKDPELMSSLGSHCESVSTLKSWYLVLGSQHIKLPLKVHVVAYSLLVK